MQTFKNLLWVIPLLALMYIYASGGVGVLIGSTEHFDLLSGLGYSTESTQLLTWLSVVIDLGGALLLIFFPSKWTFLATGLWTWVPRIIAAVGGVENEIGESLAVSVLALVAYIAYTKGHYLNLLKKKGGSLLGFY